MKRYDFANILFAGPCNLRCPFCIGKQVHPALNRNNLDEFPPRNIQALVALILQHRITEVVFTGTTTDPQLYRHEARLLDWLRRQLPAETHYALHTNGMLALRKMDTFNRYNRVSISFPSFDLETFHKMTGSWRMPELAEILRQSEAPVKLSCVITEHNVGQVDEFLCVIRAMPAGDSDGCRPPVPGHAGHLFRRQAGHFLWSAGIGGRHTLESVRGSLIEH